MNKFTLYNIATSLLLLYYYVDAMQKIAIFGSLFLHTIYYYGMNDSKAKHSPCCNHGNHGASKNKKTLKCLPFIVSIAAWDENCFILSIGEAKFYMDNSLIPCFMNPPPPSRNLVMMSKYLMDQIVINKLITISRSFAHAHYQTMPITKPCPLPNHAHYQTMPIAKPCPLPRYISIRIKGLNQSSNS